MSFFVYSSLLSITTVRPVPDLSPLKKLSGIHVDLLDNTLIKNGFSSTDYFNLDFLNKLKELNNLEFHLMTVHPVDYKIMFKVYSKVFYEMYKVNPTGLMPCIDLDDLIPKFVEEPEKILLMSVQAGLSGQVFDSTVFTKLTELEQVGLSERVIVDGGIDLYKAKILKGLKIEGVVIGSSLFQGNLENNVNEFIKLIE